MLSLAVYRDGEPAKDLNLAGAYAYGQDGVAVRAEITFADGTVSLSKKVPGACGLVLMWDAGQAGKLMISTTRLPDRPQPYILNVELARWQLTRIAQKREDWGLFDFSGADTINREFDELRLQLASALSQADPAKASAIADEVLSGGIILAEEMASYHATILLGRRKLASAILARPSFGCTADLYSLSDDFLARMGETFDFVSIPTSWKQIEPRQGQKQLEQVESWINWAASTNRPVHAGPILSFHPANLPEWLFIWEHDYETLRDMIYEHVQQMVKTFSNVRLWKVVSGIHAYNPFNLNFEQIMELTRMSCLLVKKLCPRSQVMIELVMPWGEYYARNQRTIPPLLYADMAIQSGIKFDCFGVQIEMGVPVDGLYVRDLMQASSLFDEFVGFGKPLHISACQVPSDVTPDPWDAWGGQYSPAEAGQWHLPWSQRLQADWLDSFCRIALSKPFVESVCWRDMADYEGHHIPHGGLCRNNLEPKLAFQQLKDLKASLAANAADPNKRPSPQHRANDRPKQP